MLPSDFPSDAAFQRVLADARHGVAEAQGRVLMACREYLLMVANQKLGGDLQGKVSPSDVVQETFLEAHRDFDQFHGERKEELLAWMCRILINNLANTSRGFCATDMRNVRREVPLGDDRGMRADNLAGDVPTPSKQAVAREEVAALEQAIAHLPEHYRQVIQLRYQEGMSFAEISEIMGSSAGAVHKLWARAVALVAKELNPGHEQ